MNPSLLQLVADQLHVGEPLPFGVRDEHGHLLLARGHHIASPAQLAALLQRGLYVDAGEWELARAEVAARAGAAAAARPLTIFDHWERALWALDRLLKSLDTEPDFAGRCASCANELMSLAQRDPDIAIYRSVRQDGRRLHLYGLTHAMHCALACQLVASRSGWPAERTLRLVQAALTMNLAIVDVQGVYARTGRLGDAQRAQIHAHPEAAVERLRAAGVTDASWLQAVLEHHEHPGGGGYPRGMTDPAEDACVLRLADVFLAKISPRVQRAAMPVQEAARQMYAESHASPVAAALIKEYGIYPPGNFVQLASGEYAIVIRRGATAHTPLAAAITDRAGLPIVATPQRDTAQPAFAIRGAARDASLDALAARVPPERLYGLVA